MDAMSTDIGTLQTTAVALRGDGFRAFVVSAAATLPAAAANAARPADSQDDSGLDDALRELSEHAAQSKAELRFRVDDDAGRVVVSIVDAASGDVLLQIPSEEALRISRMLRHRDGGLIEAVA